MRERERGGRNLGRERSRGRNIGRGRGRLPKGRPMWDSILGSQDHTLIEGRCSTTEHVSPRVWFQISFV